MRWARARHDYVSFGDYAELDLGPIEPQDTRWPGYAETLDRAREKSGEREAVVCVSAQSGGREIVVLSFDFRFVGGSLGERTGRLIEMAAREALSRRATLVSLVVSGGARMQEGMLSLVQMKRMAAACVDLRDAGVPHLSRLPNSWRTVSESTSRRIPPRSRRPDKNGA